MATETRDTILRTLRAQGSCTVKDLAEAADVSPVSVRHHLSNLQAENLVAVREVRHGVGRPHHLFSLTDDAIELFPTRYFRLTNRLLEEIKEHMPGEQVERLFSGVAAAMAETYALQLEGLPLPERVQRLVELLNEEGFEAEATIQDGQVIIKELSCPYFRVGRLHPEVCQIDQIFIAQALGLPVERVMCLLDGDNHCTFNAAFATTEVIPIHDG